MHKITVDDDEGFVEFILPDDFRVRIPQPKQRRGMYGSLTYDYRRLISIDMSVSDEDRRRAFPLRIYVPFAGFRKLGPLYYETLRALVGQRVAGLINDMFLSGTFYAFEVSDDELEHIRQELQADAAQ